MDRRQMLKVTGTTLACSSLLGVPALGENSIHETNKTKKALIIGAHPDDPETACGGTMILLKQADQKWEACFCHASQDMKALYDDWHLTMEQFRGLEFRCKRAESFIHLRRNNNDLF